MDGPSLRIVQYSGGGRVRWPIRDSLGRGAGSQARSWTREFRRRSLRGARPPARPLARPSRALRRAASWLSNRSGSEGHRVWSPSSGHPASARGEGELHLVAELGTCLRRPLWVTADSLPSGQDRRGALPGLGSLTCRLPSRLLLTLEGTRSCRTHVRVAGPPHPAGVSPAAA